MDKNKYNYVKPKHYEMWEGMDTWSPIIGALTKEEFVGFLKGNILKYQLRLGRKPNNSVEQDMAKIKVYEEKLIEFLNE